jgi:hypothetical protein
MHPTLLLATAFLALVLAGAWCISRILPARLPRLAGFVGGCLCLGAIALVGFCFAQRDLERVQRTCTACGRTELITSIAGVRFGREELESGERYVQRFAPVLAAGHEHVWAEYRPWLGPHPSDISGWFRELPKIADRMRADEVLRKTKAFPAELKQQVWVDFSVCVDYRPQSETSDDAFERWRTHDWPRLDGQR